MAGRPRQFDREVVLDKAVLLFWRQGFEATGIAQLSDTLGVGRQSLYGAFGDKRGLFVAALERYAQRCQRDLAATLGRPGPALDNLHRVLDGWLASARCDNYCGCFLANSCAELGVRDAELSALLGRNLARMSEALEAAIEQAQAEGDIAADTNARALAHTLVNTAHGLSTAGKVDRSFAEDAINQMRRLLA